MTPYSTQSEHCTSDVQTYLHLPLHLYLRRTCVPGFIDQSGTLTSRNFFDLIQKEKKILWLSSPALRPNLSVRQPSEQLKKLIFSLPYVRNSLLYVHPRRPRANCRDGAKISRANFF